MIMTIRSHWNNVFADFIIKLLEQFILFLFNIAGNIFCDIADIDCTINILFYQDRLCPGKVFHLEAVFQRLVCCFNPPYADI